ncbi:MAG: GHKL domain-containing protein [Erysipelotrichaceae bacterium]|nr:GHKL domain-containing protein [Erysipelotrichaceae bacterium]
MEWAVEFGFSVMDYTYLLYFYHMLIDKKWEWKKAMIGILCIAMIQFGKDMLFSFGTFSYIIDVFLVTGFLFLYAKSYNLSYYFYALLIDIIFNFSITFFVSIAIRLGIDISQTLIFGYVRIVFAMLLKSFILLVLWLSVKFLVKHRIQDMKTETITVAITVVTLVIFNYLLGSAKDNTEILLYTVLLTLVMITNFYIFYRYSIFIKSQSEAEIINQSINITSDYVTKLQKEQENIRKIRHDMKNQLTVLSILLTDGKTQEAENILHKLCDSVDSAKGSISGNLFIDAILRQKMNEYQDIEFLLDIQVTKDCVIDGKYIISLLSNIIDNACEELRRIKETDFNLQINGNQSQMMIKAQNKCRNDIDLKTDKDKLEHGYGLKIIHEIAHKYDGNVLIDVKDGFFDIRVLLFFTNNN